MSSVTSATNSSLHAAIRHDGFAFVHGGAMRDLLAPYGPLADWTAFADSWNHLELDTYMADGGRYRRRRHAVYSAGPDAPIVREPHQPHFQAIDYNPLNGGVARWFEPIDPGIGSGSSMTTILAFCRALFESLSLGNARVAHRNASVPDRSAVGRGGTPDARRPAPRRRRLRARAASRPPEHRERRDVDQSTRRPAARSFHADRSVRRRARRRHARRARRHAGRTDRSGVTCVSRCAGGDVQEGSLTSVGIALEGGPQGRA